MGSVIQVTTQDGVKGLDLESASWLKVMVGGIEYEVRPPDIAPLFAPLNETLRAQQDLLHRMAEDFHEDSRQSRQKFRDQYWLDGRDVSCTDGRPDDRQNACRNSSEAARDVSQKQKHQ